ncbi:MAG: DNA repair protein RadA [Lachnospiraceae bacterium]|nr:DNA repair protein RadA [Lachnospiraceae bacterium]MCI7043190.1 DNA repair protein RadA [Lachnospiraceae bacterium]MCI7190638.1 DNA repair protein RadA [Lachnospiraceae bacterium]MDD7628049.1 DNA repair protein RadA [Lachnospiraceae bacterium]MDY4119832.1 DNA repair protein RadA [Lachnospiraceae bacterium]
MAKGKNTVFFCQNCGYESAKWMGQCPGCREWNTFVEEQVVTGQGKSSRMKTVTGFSEKNKPAKLSEVSIEKEDRISTGIGELDRVLGGGIVAGSLTLVGGDPGIGKSTLLLQVCRNLAGDGREVLYVSGEESLKQIKLRANRIGTFSDHLKLLCETDLESIEETIRRSKPEVVIIDSIQTMFHGEISAAPGSISQVREATGLFLQLAKGLGVSIFIVGHVTKEGTVAGPRVLEHMVDTVLYFEGDRHASYRLLRGVKNRFGSTNEIGVFEMEAEGLREVLNPSEFMLNGRPENASGSVVACSMEGTRPILVEIQALVCHSNFGIPRRQTTGTDFNRVNLLMAVLEKRLGLQMGNCDAYVNIAGGIKIQEPAIDLGIAMAIVSSFKNRAVSSDMIVMGEVGLSGEVRAVSMIPVRVQEAKKLGFATCVIPSVCMDSVKEISGIKIIGVSHVGEAMDLI